MKKVNLMILVTRVCMRKPFFILRKQAKLMGNYFIIPKRNLDHLCPAVYAMTKMADLKKFRQSEGMFMDSTILASFSQIHQNEISLAVRRFWQIFAIFVTACISGHISFRQGNFLTSRKMFNPEGKWNRQRELFNPYANKTNWGKCTTRTKNETARDRERGIFISENKMTLKGRLICPNGKWNHRENCLPQRKEKLWEEMINLYNKGDCWSKTYHSMILKCKLKGK